MNYITNHAYGCMLYKNESNQIINMSSISYIKHLCENHLFTYQGYLKACRKKFDLKYKIPLYICEILQLIPTKSYRAYDVMWINYAAIERYEAINQKVRIYFFDHSQLMIDISYQTFKKQIIRLNQIRDVKVKHFHS